MITNLRIAFVSSSNEYCGHVTHLRGVHVGLVGEQQDGLAAHLVVVQQAPQHARALGQTLAVTIQFNSF